MSSVVPVLYDVTLEASNVEELGRFYARLGLRQAIDDEDLKVFILGVNELEIRREHTAEPKPATIRVSVERLERVQQLLRAEAIDYQERTAEHDGLSVLVRDPNGNLIQFVSAQN